MAVPLAGPQLIPLALTTALAVGAGAEAHTRLHPRFPSSDSRSVGGFWIGPALTALAAALAAGRLDGDLVRAAAVVGAALVGVLVVAQDREIDGRRQQRWTPLAFGLTLYLAAFVLFAVIYGWSDLLLLSILACGLCGALLSAALFRPTRAPRARVWLFAALVGVCIAELTAALGTWTSAGLVGGAFLLLYFYVATGLINALLDGSLDRRLVVEYGLVAAVGLLLIISTSPLRP